MDFSRFLVRAAIKDTLCKLIAAACVRRFVRALKVGRGPKTGLTHTVDGRNLRHFESVFTGESNYHSRVPEWWCIFSLIHSMDQCAHLRLGLSPCEEPSPESWAGAARFPRPLEKKLQRKLGVEVVGVDQYSWPNDHGQHITFLPAEALLLTARCGKQPSTVREHSMLRVMPSVTQTQTRVRPTPRKPKRTEPFVKKAFPIWVWVKIKPPGDRRF